VMDPRRRGSAPSSYAVCGTQNWLRKARIQVAKSHRLRHGRCSLNGFVAARETVLFDGWESRGRQRTGKMSVGPLVARSLHTPGSKTLIGKPIMVMRAFLR